MSEISISSITGISTITGSIVASTNDYRTNAADKFLTTDVVWDAATEVTLTSSSNTTSIDFKSGLNFTLTLTENTTLANSPNKNVGQSGYIRLLQDATGGRTLSYGTDYVFTQGTAPSVSTGANDLNILFYHILSGGDVFIAAAVNVS